MEETPCEHDNKVGLEKNEQAALAFIALPSSLVEKYQTLPFVVGL